MSKVECCGLEVSARELLVALGGKQEESVLRRFANTAAGRKELVQTLTRGGRRVSVCLEATGLYGLEVALLLSTAEGIELMVANPRAVRNFARAMMRRSKTDELDAVVLREFAERMEFRAWVRPSAAALALWGIARRLGALAEEHAAEKNRMHAACLTGAIPGCVRRSIARMLRFQEREMEQLRAEARERIAGDALLRRRYEMLRSVTGIGEVSALQILAELCMLPEDRDVRQWVAFAGLDPRQYSSGTSVHQRPRISKVGNRRLRKALFMPALVASRREPHLRGFYQHLLERGKKKKPALVAVERKLLHAIYGMFRNQQNYDGNRVFPLATRNIQVATANCR